MRTGLSSPAIIHSLARYYFKVPFKYFGNASASVHLSIRFDFGELFGRFLILPGDDDWVDASISGRTGSVTQECGAEMKGSTAVFRVVCISASMICRTASYQSRHRGYFRYLYKALPSREPQATIQKFILLQNRNTALLFGRKRHWDSPALFHIWKISSFFGVLRCHQISAL